MFRHPAWAVGSYSSGPSAARDVGTKSTGGFANSSVSPWRVMNKDRSLFMNDSTAQKAERLSFLFTRKSFNFGAILSPKICTILQIIPKRKPILMYKKRIIQLFEP